MSHIGFAITLNGERICRAGLENDQYVLSCILDSVRIDEQNRKEIKLHVSALDSVKQENVRWTDVVPLKEGDTIDIEVIENDFDMPELIPPPDPKALLELQLKAFYELKDKLKNHLDENDEPTRI